MGVQEPFVLLLQDQLPQQQGHPYNLISDLLVTENSGNLFQCQTLDIFLIPCQVLPEEEGLQARMEQAKMSPSSPGFWRMQAERGEHLEGCCQQGGRTLVPQCFFYSFGQKRAGEVFWTSDFTSMSCNEMQNKAGDAELK